MTGLNRPAVGAYSKDARAATNFHGSEKSRIWLGVDILWPDGETEAIRGFITEYDAVKWITEHEHSRWCGL
jgi:hypothetical protein